MKTTITITGQRAGNNVLKAALNDRFEQYKEKGNGYVFFYESEEKAAEALAGAFTELHFAEPDYEGLYINQDVGVITYDASTARMDN